MMERKFQMKNLPTDSKRKKLRVSQPQSGEKHGEVGLLHISKKVLLQPNENKKHLHL